MSRRSTHPIVAFVSYRAATPDGDGGNHRTYQILHDVQAEFGCDGVVHVAFEDWATRRESWQSYRRGPVAGMQVLPRRLRQRVLRITENPYNLLSREGWSQRARFGTRGVLPREFCEQYVDRVLRRGVSIGLVDHALFDQIRQLNARAGVATLVATHNLESLDAGGVRFASRVATQRNGIDFGNELWSLSRFAERLAISKIETAVLNGVGLSCQFYPYVAIGEVQAQLVRIAVERGKRRPDPRLFAVIGTAFHAPTRRSLEWFIEHVARHGLPGNTRAVLVGSHVDQLVPRGCHLLGLEVRGRVSDAELADLLARAGTALVPQRMGFGALTRIAELSCAGVPSLVFPHAGRAIDLPPGAQVLKDDAWCTLVDGICQATDAQPTIEPEDYRAWEERQARPLGPALRRVLAE